MTTHQYLNSGPLIKLIVGMHFYTNNSYYHDIIPEGTKLLTPEEITQINMDYPDLTAIIHIGPAKTLSSSIQASFKNILGNNNIDVMPKSCR